MNDIKEFKKLLEKYTEGRRFDEETIVMLKQSIGFRLNGWSFESIAKHFALTRTRINNLEKSFIKSLTTKQGKLYNELVNEAKKDRRTIR